MEEEPRLHFSRADGSELEVGPHQLTIFQFIGQSVLITGETIENETRNHIFVTIEQDDNISRGHYVFPTENYYFDALDFAVRNDSVMHLNLPEIPTCDEIAYQKAIARTALNEMEEAGDFLPSDWDSDGAA
jgi:hypothetical protein